MALGASAAVVVGGGVEFSFVSSSKIEGMETPLIELFANRILGENDTCRRSRSYHCKNNPQSSFIVKFDKITA